MTSDEPAADAERLAEYTCQLGEAVSLTPDRVELEVLVGMPRLCEQPRQGRRKPPEPSPYHSEIDDWFRRQMPHLQPIVRELDESIRATIPGLHYAVKWKRPYYGRPELGWIIELAAYDVSVNVVFLGGADLESPPPLGTTDRTRYTKVTTLEEAQRPELHKWIEEASRTPGWT